ncbi:MAG: hypothetical protein MUC50_22080 [Myxococcota bacterium]|jgi:predicted acetyltransferase|nr:hypothetical protein [Myxococcota bacterium]
MEAPVLENSTLRTKTMLFCLLLTLAYGRTSKAESPDDILVIAHKAVDAAGLDRAALKDIFLKKRLVWKDGVNAVPMNAPLGTKLRKEFQERLLGKSENETQRYWEEFKIRSGGAEPVQFGNAIRPVFHLRGAVGYIYRAQYQQGVVQILLVLPATQ